MEESTGSGYIARQAAEIRRGEDAATRLQRIASEVQGLPAAAFPPRAMLNVIGSHDLDHFRQIGLHLFQEIAGRLKLEKDAHVLDLGCGCGRIALPFVHYLADGRLYGCDAWGDGIEWCRANLTGAGNAEFHVNQTTNNYYFEALDPAKVNPSTLPWLPRHTLDAAFAISVFTHLRRVDAQAYLDEIGRTLKPNGFAYLTFFLIDKYVHRYVARTGHHTALAETEPGCWHAYSGQDFFAGFTMETLEAMFAAAGLRIVSLDLGSWAEKPGARVYQDTILLEPR